MASSQAYFSHFNCLTLVPFLCLIVTSDLPLGAFCAQQHDYDPKLGSPLMADYVHDLNLASKANYANTLLLHSSVHGKRGFSTIGSTSAVLSLDDVPALAPTNSFASLSSSSTKRALNEATANNKNNHDDILILGKANKRSLSSSPASHAGVKGDSSFARRDLGYSSIKLSQPRLRPRRRRASTNNGETNAFINSDYAKGMSTTLRAGASTNVDELATSSTVKTLNEMMQSPPIDPELVEDRLIDSFPVAYLMNSQYELEPPLISNAIEMGRAGGGGGDSKSRKLIAEENDARFVYKSDVGNRRGVMASARDLEISLLLQNNDEGSDQVPSDDHLDHTTIKPSDGTLAMIVEQIPTNRPATEDEESMTNSSNPIVDTDNPDNATVEPGTIPLRRSCNETSQCFGEHVECRLYICKCQLGYLPRIDNGELCGEASAHHVEVPTTDPTMIGVVVGLALMSVTLCVVLRLFAKARFRENRTIFNTPNPRLMNVSLLKGGSKTLLRGNSAGQRSRRGSIASNASGGGQGQGEGQGDGNPEGNGAGSSSTHPTRIKPSRTLSTDTANLEGTGTPTSSRPLTSNRSKFRQDSVASNV